MSNREVVSLEQFRKLAAGLEEKAADARRVVASMEKTGRESLVMSYHGMMTRGMAYLSQYLAEALMALAGGLSVEDWRRRLGSEGKRPRKRKGGDEAARDQK